MIPVYRSLLLEKIHDGRWFLRNFHNHIIAAEIGFYENGAFSPFSPESSSMMGTGGNSGARSKIPPLAPSRSFAPRLDLALVPARCTTPVSY